MTVDNLALNLFLNLNRYFFFREKRTNLYTTDVLVAVVTLFLIHHDQETENQRYMRLPRYTTRITRIINRPMSRRNRQRNNAERSMRRQRRPRRDLLRNLNLFIRQYNKRITLRIRMLRGPRTRTRRRRRNASSRLTADNDPERIVNRTSGTRRVNLNRLLNNYCIRHTRHATFAINGMKGNQRHVRRKRRRQALGRRERTKTDQVNIVILMRLRNLATRNFLKDLVHLTFMLILGTLRLQHRHLRLTRQLRLLTRRQRSAHLRRRRRSSGNGRP